MTATHNHKTAERKNFTNTNFGCMEICECGASRLALPQTYMGGVTRTEWQAAA